VKKISVCLVSFFSLGAIGPCLGTAAPRLDENETVETPTTVSEPPPEPIEPTEPDEPVIPPPSIVPPRLPPPPAPPTPPLPPPPTPEPEPIVTEPELKIWTCDEFPPLSLEATPAGPLIRTLTSDQATHFWQTLTCPFSPLNGLGEISGCERLLAGTYTNAYDQYYSVFRFPLTDLPDAEDIESVVLNLYPLQGSVFFIVTLSLDIEILAADWWRGCQNESEDWRPLCDDELPLTRADGSINWQLETDERGYYRLSLDIAEPYQKWQTGEWPNYGLMISQSASLFNFFILAGPDHPDPINRPHLVITSKTTDPTLRFPLAGVYDRSRITGYDFGEWWEKGYCLDGKTPLRHTGVDFQASPGDSVYAISDGKVVYASLSDKWGGYVVLEHGEKWTSACIHVLPTVIVGDTVTRGDPIATIAYGNTNFDPHLHFQMLSGSYDPGLARRGRLPDKSCVVAGSPYPQPEPAFPDKFIDPKCLDWE